MGGSAVKREGSEHNPFTPPQVSFIPTLLIAVAIAVGGWAVYRVQTEDMPASVDHQVESSNHLPAPGPLPLPVPSHTQIEPLSKTATPAWIRCQVDDRVVYSDRGCEGGVALRNAQNSQASISTVPAWEQSAGVGERSQTQVNAHRSTIPATQMARSDPKWACKSLDEEIKSLDAEARRPLSAHRQDDVRAQRKAARDRQFALRC